MPPLPNRIQLGSKANPSPEIPPARPLGLGGRLSNLTTWTEKTVALPLVFDDKTTQLKPVKVRAYGSLAIHRVIGSKQPTDYWTVTSLTTGLRIVTVKEEEDAARIVETLHRYGAKAFVHEVWEDMIVDLPRWIRPWIYECRKEEEFTDYRPFMEKADAAKK